MFTLECTEPESFYFAQLFPSSADQATLIVRKATNDADLHDSTRYFGEALSTLSDGFVIIRNADHLPVADTNRVFEEITGFNEGEVLQKSIRLLEAGESQLESWMKFYQDLRQGNPSRLKLRAYHKDGSLILLDLSFSPLRNQNEAITHYLGVIRDITESVYAQAELNRQQKLDQSVGESSKKSSAVIDLILH